MADYTDLSDEGRIELAIRFVANNQPLPKELVEFLREAGIYDLIVKPQESFHGQPV
ncbi:hypothetical protein [Pannonibacter sp. SL95]|uniref:hypothetical protein n=1 Tax=Pannonibacter sp. SL95 TaxID=2995153 RepID=UPI002274DBC9|nr:hypothetical protein [Pannonibacter sp. SL95]MCY1708367.1 hypothetical protein [Pannonibacter sp. SL95]